MDSRTMGKMIVPVWEWSETLELIAHKYPHRYKDFAYSIRKNQWESKTWLMEILAVVNEKENPVIWVLGSWYGTVIVPLIFEYIKDVKEVHLFDYDSEAFEICHSLHGKWNGKIVRHQRDINFEIDLLKSYEVQPDIVINTSCEHMWHMRDLLLEDKSILYAFQSNNFDLEPAHINGAYSLEKFKEQCGLTTIEYEGSKPFHDIDDGYKRWMVIGYND